ncbi:hypothetical protein AB0H97_14150 [Streptomyces sp. NPDC050788]|uniref:hypothetical protein n=1 Tax=Streptomyces sp. NPDC050788 TaxID=3155041 RepID=UPI00342672B1
MATAASLRAASCRSRPGGSPTATGAGGSPSASTHSTPSTQPATTANTASCSAIAHTTASWAAPAYPRAISPAAGQRAPPHARTSSAHCSPSTRPERSSSASGPGAPGDSAATTRPFRRCRTPPGDPDTRSRPVHPSRPQAVRACASRS